MKPTLKTIVGISMLLAVPLASGCDKNGQQRSKPSDPGAARATPNRVADAGAARAVPSALAGALKGGSLLLVAEGRGMVVADSTSGLDCAALLPKLVGETFTSGGAGFRFTAIGPSRDPALPATEAISPDVLLYEHVAGAKNVEPDVTILPARGSSDAKKAIDWVAWERDATRPEGAAKAAFRHALRSEARSKDAELVQIVKANVTGAAEEDLLIVASASYPECERDPDKCTNRDTAWLLLVPEGEASRTTIVWTGQDEEWLSIWNTYDLDGDGVHGFSLSIGSNPNESATQFAGRIRDGALSTTCSR